MSWLQDLAGKAENILNKIDQNAATVLQLPKTEGDDVDGLREVTCESVNNVKSGIPRVPSKGYLSLARPATPKKNTVNLDEKINQLLNDNTSTKSEKPKHFDLQSRRSSQSSSKDNTVISKETQDASNPVKLTYSIEKELEAAKIVLSEVKLERDDLKNELESLIEQQNNNKNRNRIVELEELCNLLVEEKNIMSQRTITMEDSNSKYIKSISELESTISKLHQNEIELQQKLEWAKNESSQAVSELQQYRLRAQTTLQIKEKLIDELKSGRDNSVNSDNPAVSPNEDILKLEIEHLKSEKQNLLQEVNTLNEKYEQSRKHISSLEKHYKDINSTLEQKILKMEETFNLETTKGFSYENDLKLQNQELNSLKDEMSKMRMTYTAKLQDKESELLRFKNKIAQRPMNSSNDIEERINSLTQSLVQKQNSLESITVERNALRLQLEKLDNQHKSTMLQIRQQRQHLLSVNETDDAKSQVPEFLIESPFDHKITRRVKRAYSSLDGVGIRLGVFLRRYPLVRILVIFYIVILHIWVMIVLLSSTPT